jgi:hypothetical protein
MPETIDMTPDSLDLLLYAGDGGDFQVCFVDTQNVPIDVFGWLFSAQIRKSRTSPEHRTLTINMGDASNGIITIMIPKEVTRDLANDQWNTEWVWDLQTITPDRSDPTTLLQGDVVCTQDVTK